jgi:uncharacterized protein YndB with AHSA1/START domain
MQTEIKHTWHFNQSPQEVWEYLTKPELLEQWLMKSDFKPILGHKFCFTAPKGMVHYCEVLEIKPFTKLSYSWQRDSAKDGKPFDSKVMWTLVPKKEGTELQLVHNGFTALEDYTQHNNGWTMLVNGLVERLNTVKK